jgi:integrase
MEMKGSIYNKNTKRKEVDIYKKHELVTSHIGRRSFATNHFGKLPNSVIMRVCGWSKEEMMLKYIKKSNREDAVALQQYWEETYKT